MSIASFLRKIRKQDAVYWAVTGSDGFGGELWGAPTEVGVRWSDRAERTFTSDGREFVSKAKIFFGFAPVIGSMVKLGGLSSDTNDNPLEEEDTFRILSVKSVPDIKNKAMLYVGYC
jgi:hypothetical protein